MSSLSALTVSRALASENLEAGASCPRISGVQSIALLMLQPCSNVIRSCKSYARRNVLSRRIHMLKVTNSVLCWPRHNSLHMTLTARHERTVSETNSSMRLKIYCFHTISDNDGGHTRIANAARMTKISREGLAPFALRKVFVKLWCPLLSPSLGPSRSSVRIGLASPFVWTADLRLITSRCAQEDMGCLHRQGVCASVFSASRPNVCFRSAHRNHVIKCLDFSFPEMQWAVTLSSGVLNKDC